MSSTVRQIIASIQSVFANCTLSHANWHAHYNFIAVLTDSSLTSVAVTSRLKRSER